MEQKDLEIIEILDKGYELIDTIKSVFKSHVEGILIYRDYELKVAKSKNNLIVLFDKCCVYDGFKEIAFMLLDKFVTLGFAYSIEKETEIYNLVDKLYSFSDFKDALYYQRNEKAKWEYEDEYIWWDK